MGVDGVRQERRAAGTAEPEGRPYSEIEKTTVGLLALSASGAEGTVTICRPGGAAVEVRWPRMRVDEAIVGLSDVHDPATLKLVPALVEAELAAITPAGR